MTLDQVANNYPALYGTSSPLALSIHDRLHLEANIRNKHKEMVATLHSTRSAKTARNTTFRIEDSLIRKGKEMIMKKQRQRERAESVRMEGLQNKPSINPKSEAIMKNKRIYQGSVMSSTSQMSHLDERAKICVEKRPNFSARNLLKHKEKLQSFNTTEKPVTKGLEFISRSTVDFKRAYYYQKIVENRRERDSIRD